MNKRLEYRDGVSHKFWEISRKGSKVTKSWGRVGTDGQQQVKGVLVFARQDFELAWLEVLSAVRKPDLLKAVTIKFAFVFQYDALATRV